MSDEDIQKIADTYHNWRGDGDGEYADVPGFCKAASLDEIRKNGYVLTPSKATIWCFPYEAMSIFQYHKYYIDYHGIL
ncbi:N-6 DNA methylase [Acidithiobacillus ferrianus]|uniref:N-6 DNA methylase n=1 Tax=Acidithiobacillus ferrianus TaxID=2678518 RepID=A0ACD5HAG6_9PROT|nr:N-6 DNA methylase [Acidithiobacillus ferrianus]